MSLDAHAQNGIEIKLYGKRRKWNTFSLRVAHDAVSGVDHSMHREKRGVDHSPGIDARARATSGRKLGKGSPEETIGTHPFITSHHQR